MKEKQRDIKFRAYWFKNDTFQNCGMTDSFTLEEFGVDQDGTYGDGDYPNQYAIDNKLAIIMQYTGLKDKNGKEIYEGDILQHESIDPMIEVVEWKKNMWTEEGFMTGYGDWWGTPDQYEVIGNIHENPELLEKSGQI